MAEYYPRVYFLVQGSDGASVHQFAWLQNPVGTPGHGWAHDDVTSETNAPLAYSFSDLATIGTGANSDPRIYYLSGDGHVNQLAWLSAQGTWAPPFDLTGNANPPAFVGSDSATSGGLAAMGSGSNSDPHIFYLSPDGHVQHLAWNGSAFVSEDVFSNVTQGTAVPA